jgi:hypothetical protein
VAIWQKEQDLGLLFPFFAVPIFSCTLFNQLKGASQLVSLPMASEWHLHFLLGCKVYFLGSSKGSCIAGSSLF